METLSPCACRPTLSYLDVIIYIPLLYMLYFVIVFSIHLSGYKFTINASTYLL